jgi:hypothetical protein
VVVALALHQERLIHHHLAEGGQARHCVPEVGQGRHCLPEVGQGGVNSGVVAIHGWQDCGQRELYLGLEQLEWGGTVLLWLEFWRSLRGFFASHGARASRDPCVVAH